MPKRSSTPKSPDVNQLAKRIADTATGDKPAESGPAKPEKNPAAVALGRLGGLKGGKARAKALTKKARQEIAKYVAGPLLEESDV